MKTKSKILVIGAFCFGAFLFGAVASTMLSAQSDSLSTTPSFTSPTFSFLKNLKFGDNSQDVRQLQIVLNSDVDTSIFGSSIGSKGQEGTYFGQLTAGAVKRFQSKYGIDTTGFVGALTRARLNQIVSSFATVPVSIPPAGIVPNALPTTTATSSRVSGPLPLQKERLPRLYTVRPRQIKKGDTFTLVGAGFQIENTIHIGTNVFSHVAPLDNSNISFTIPASSDIQNGTYEIWVENSQGNSQIPGKPIELSIVDSPRSSSVISSVLPATVAGTETVTVTGTGFASDGNSIVSGLGTIKNLSSNGTQITFSPRSLISSEVASRIGTGKTIRVDFYVVNAGVASNVSGSVNLKL